MWWTYGTWLGFGPFVVRNTVLRTLNIGNITKERCQTVRPTILPQTLDIGSKTPDMSDNIMVFHIPCFLK